MERVLVANRGEIAVRVIRACHRLGVEAVVVHSEPDARSLAVDLADGAVALAGSAAADTYLAVERVVAAAVEAGCDAVHPGYGFLAERADFAASVADAGLIWVGPPADVIALMGDKLAARRTAIAAGVQPVPGATAALDDADAVRRLGEELGWPLAIKAAHGGGGRGMRIVTGPEDAVEALASSRREAESAFGRPEVYVERYLARPRHVEVQILADAHGGLLVVGDRDCSIQRRYQKLIEEAPAPQLPQAVRTRLATAAERLGRAVGYVNAGTVEFLVDRDDVFFLEMNTRIQVEHPVTELVAGVDLVAEQLRVADGEPLSFAAEDVRPHGAAIEVRINAEHVAGGSFLPAPGALATFNLPTGPHVRVDTGYRAGDAVPPEYDNLVAKLVVWGTDRDDARRRAIQALGELEIAGIPTTAALAALVLDHDDFRRVSHSTRWLEDHADELVPATPAAGSEADETTPDIAAPAGPPAEVQVLGRWYRIPRFTDGTNPGDVAGGTPRSGAGQAGPPRGRATAINRHRAGDGRVRAPMQGTVTAVDVQVGDTVTASTRVIALEAMKMENALRAGVDGVVAAVHVAVGASVAPGTVLVEITAD